MRYTLLTLLAMLALVAAWTKEDHEIFRIKDELESNEGAGVTFYDYFGISPSANQEDIAKAYRKKGKLLHPDKAKQAFVASRATAASKKARASAKSASSKAKAEGKPTTSVKAPKPTARAVKPPSEREIRAVVKKATEDFARLGLIYKILQGADRERYDHFLQNGFPAWRGTGYYYSRYRPGGGTVLFGLFVFAGGAVHYLVLILGWKRQRDFVQRYIQQARTLAWGDASPMAAIPGISDAGQPTATSTAVPPPAEENDGVAPALNRRERRAQEKAKKKPSAKDRARNGSGTATPQNEPANTAGASNAGPAGPVPGPRKRVQAENGKILVVDSAGNVFLEEMVHADDADSDDEGEPQLFLLDADEMPRPTVRDTMIYRLPVWLFHRASALTQRPAKATPAETQGKARATKPATKAAGAPPSTAVASTSASPAIGASETSSGDDEVDGFVTVGDKPAGTSGSKAKKRKGKKGR